LKRKLCAGRFGPVSNEGGGTGKRITWVENWKTAERSPCQATMPKGEMEKHEVLMDEKRVTNARYGTVQLNSFAHADILHKITQAAQRER